MRFLEPYRYRLTIINNSLYDLVLHKRQLIQGVWFREDVDGQGPAAVPAGATVEALGIRAGIDPRKGYEFLCAWSCDVGETTSTLSIHMSIPFGGGRNKAGMDVSGLLKVNGWTGVLAIGHRFEHTLAISLSS